MPVYTLWDQMFETLVVGVVAVGFEIMLWFTRLLMAAR